MLGSRSRPHGLHRDCFHPIAICLPSAAVDPQSDQATVIAWHNLFNGNIDPQRRWRESGVAITGQEGENVQRVRLRHYICNRLHLAAMAISILQWRAFDEDDHGLAAVVNVAIEALSDWDGLALDIGTQSRRERWLELYCRIPVQLKASDFAPKFSPLTPTRFSPTVAR